MVEQLPFKEMVVGSIPTGRTINKWTQYGILGDFIYTPPAEIEPSSDEVREAAGASGGRASEIFYEW